MTPSTARDLVVSYQTVDPDPSFFLGEGREFQRKKKASERSFRQFEKLRGEVVTAAIAVERELDRVISWYFVPRLTDKDDPLRREEDIRRDALEDLLLGQEGMNLSAKVNIVSSILAAAEIPQPSKTKFRGAMKPVYEIRNMFAHRKVGVSWKTHTVALWDSRRREWGFPEYKSDGKLDERKWNESVPENFANLYSDFSSRASTMIHDVWSQIVRTFERNVT